MLDNDALHSSILDLDSWPLKVLLALSNASSARAMRVRLLIVCFTKSVADSGLLESANILAKASSILCFISQISQSKFLHLILLVHFDIWPSKIKLIQFASSLI